MQHCLKTLSAGLVAACAVLSAAALDNTVSNDFWCTWNYVNPSPGVASADGALADTFVSNSRASDVLDAFSSEKLGLWLIVR